MDNTHKSPASVALAGLFAGMLGALAVSAMVALGRTVMAGADEPRDPFVWFTDLVTRKFPYLVDSGHGLSVSPVQSVWSRCENTPRSRGQ